MTVETHVDRARDRVAAERQAIEAKTDAFDAFAARVKAVKPRSTGATGGVFATAGQRLRPDGGDDGCRAVRTAFEETVRPHSVADVEDPEPLLETVRTELTDPIAVVLAPASDATLTESVKRAIVEEATSRCAEAAALEVALDRETTRLSNAGAVVDEITEWIVAADETPLSELGFDDLRDRHRTLATHRERCSSLLADRQSFLQRSSSASGAAGVRHRALIGHLYDDFPIDHPVLSTGARLHGTCGTCQRSVRRHLVRRG